MDPILNKEEERNENRVFRISYLLSSLAQWFRLIIELLLIKFPGIYDFDFLKPAMDVICVIKFRLTIVNFIGILKFVKEKVEFTTIKK
jgi:hypothetical protein